MTEYPTVSQVNIAPALSVAIAKLRWNTGYTREACYVPTVVTMCRQGYRAFEPCPCDQKGPGLREWFSPMYQSNLYNLLRRLG